MGKFTNLVLIAAATALIVFGIAAQTGTISMGGATSHGPVTGSHALTPPKSPAVLPSSLPTAASQQPAAAPAGGGGGDGGDGGD